MTRLLRLVLSVLLVPLVAAAQTPVPVDRYGPPPCTAGPTPARRMTAGAGVAEQEQGALLLSAIGSAEPLENFSLARYRLVDYGDCVDPKVCYWADLDAQYKRAESAMRLALGTRKPGDKLAIVMDVDETTLTNYCEMKREDFGYILSLSTPWVLSRESAVAIPGALRLFNEAKTAGVAVFFLTGRPGKPEQTSAKPWIDQTEATARNLEAAGFSGWTGLQLRNGAENREATIEYKATERMRFAEQGYRLLLNVGDQWSDLLGPAQAETSVKLPNPFYFIP